MRKPANCILVSCTTAIAFISGAFWKSRQDIGETIGYDFTGNLQRHPNEWNMPDILLSPTCTWIAMSATFATICLHCLRTREDQVSAVGNDRHIEALREAYSKTRTRTKGKKHSDYVDSENPRRSCSMYRLSSIHDDRCAGHERGRIGHQERDNITYLVAFGRTAEHDPRLDGVHVDHP